MNVNRKGSLSSKDVDAFLCASSSPLPSLKALTNTVNWLAAVIKLMIQDFVLWCFNTSSYFCQKRVGVIQTAAFPDNHHAISTRTEVDAK